MSDQNVHNAGFTSSGIARGSLASSVMSKEATASGGGVRSGGATSTLQEMGEEEFAVEYFAQGILTPRSRYTDKLATDYRARGSTHSSGFTSSGISGGSRAAGMMSKEATTHGGGIPRGGTTSTVQSISMGGKGGRR